MNANSKILSKTYLVVKLGKLYSHLEKTYLAVDPLIELDNILSKSSSCYFAKFGIPLKIERINELAKSGTLYLVVAYVRDDVFLSKTYKVKSASYETPKKPKSYPAYYKDKLEFAGTWIEITSDSHQAALSELRVKSSYQRVLSAFANSNGSAYYCKTS